jgi:hypothetical protein
MILSGDATSYVQNIRWAAWEQSGATGHGTVTSEGCVPNCAQGTQTATPVTLYLNNAQSGHFTSLTEDITGQPENKYMDMGEGWVLGNG